MAGARRLELLVDDAVFGESPRWHEDALWFSDIGGDKVWRIAADGTRTAVITTVRAPSGLGWTRDGRLLVTSLHDHTIYQLGADGIARGFCGPQRHGTLGTNDMATWGSRSYVTCAGREHRMGDTLEQVAAPVGKLLMLDHDSGDVRTVAEGYAMPNGIAFTPGGKTLVFSELFASRLLQFDVEADGSLSNQRIFATLDGFADGICMDAEGAVWASIGGGGACHWQRIDATGAVLDEIPLEDGYHCVACALGGADGRDLFLVANKTDSPDDVFNGRARSCVYKTRVECPAPAET